MGHIMALLVENDGVVVLAFVTAEQFKNNYALRLQDPGDDDERVAVKILDINVRGNPPKYPGKNIRVKKGTFVDIPPMRYYLKEHQDVAAWVATHDPDDQQTSATTQMGRRAVHRTPPPGTQPTAVAQPFNQ